MYTLRSSFAIRKLDHNVWHDASMIWYKGFPLCAIALLLHLHLPLLSLPTMLPLIVVFVLVVATATRATAHNQLVPCHRRRGCIFIMKRVNLHENEMEMMFALSLALSSQWSISVAPPRQIYMLHAHILRRGLSVFMAMPWLFYSRCILSLELSIFFFGCSCSWFIIYSK